MYLYDHHRRLSILSLHVSFSGRFRVIIVVWSSIGLIGRPVVSGGGSRAILGCVSPRWKEDG